MELGAWSGEELGSSELGSSELGSSELGARIKRGNLVNRGLSEFGARSLERGAKL